MRSEQTKLVTVPGALPAQASRHAPAAPARTRPLAALLWFARNKPLGAVGGIIVLILILTALGEVKDKVRCFNLGADDYLTKPFDLDEFEARVRALVRRGKGRLDPTLKCGALLLDTSSATARIGDQPLVLRRREVTVLEILMSHAGRLVRKERLISEVFGFDDPVAPNAIELYIARLRQKLGPQGPTIKTVRGLGYLMEDR